MRTTTTGRHFGVAALAVLTFGGMALTACGDDDSDTADPADTTPAATSPSGSQPVETSPSGGQPVERPVAATPDDLDDREFIAQYVEGFEVAPDSEIRVRFAGGHLYADAGCNNMGADYSLTDGVLSTGPLAMTEMACQPELMDQDTWVAELLSGSPMVLVTLDEMILDGAETGSITMLDREVAEPDLPLEGSEWVVDGLVANEGVASIPAGGEATLLIEGDTATFHTGCNGGTAPVEVGETTLTFGVAAVQRKACPPELTDLENAFLAVVQGEVDYAIESNRLSLSRITDGVPVGLEMIAER